MPLITRKHGTPQGYIYCKDNNGNPCESCLKSMRDRNRLGKIKTQIKHGTPYGYTRCLKSENGPCQECKDASAEARRVLNVKRQAGDDTRKGRRVRCLETNIIYASARKAARDLDVDYNAVCRNVRGLVYQAGEYHFELVD